MSDVTQLAESLATIADSLEKVASEFEADDQRRAVEPPENFQKKAALFRDNAAIGEVSSPTGGGGNPLLTFIMS